MERKTYEISRDEIKDMPVLAEGYKAVNWDGSTNQDFSYCGADDQLVGRVFKVDGDIKKCDWGLHFCKCPADIFKFYKPLGYNRYFKVRAYGKVTDDTDKSVASIIEFVEEFGFEDFIKIVQNYDYSSNSYGTAYSRGTADSYGTSDSYGTAYSRGTADSYGISKCNGVYNSAFCNGKNGIANYVFNKKCTERRAKEIICKLRSFNYFPKFTNYLDVKGDKPWSSFCFPRLKENDTATAWSDMPREMLDYIRSLPEFDAEIFEKVTGIKS